MNTILIIVVVVVVVAVCVYVWQISFDIELHIQSVTWCFQKRKWMWIHIYTFLFLKCHLYVTCLVIRDVSICKVSIDVWFFLHKSYFMSKSKLGMSIDLYFVFVQVLACQVSNTCKNFVKNTHWSPLSNTKLFWSLHVGASAYKHRDLWVACVR